MDGIPEFMVLGLSLLSGGVFSYVAEIAIFLSNVPEGLSRSAGMKNAGRSAVYIFGISAGIAVLSGISALLGYAGFQYFTSEVFAVTTVVAAEAMLAMLVDTVIPEAFQEAQDFAGLIAVLGFLVSFILYKLG